MKDADLMISGGRVLTMDEAGTRYDDGAVAVSGNTIVAVGPRQDIVTSYRAREVISGRGCIVMPGLINGHTHAAMACFRGIADDLKLEDWLNHYIFPAEAKNVDRELVYWGSLLACAEMVKSGTTAFCDMYIFEDETAKAAKEAGMRCLVGEVLFDFPSPNYATPAEGLAYARRMAEKWAGDPLVRVMVEPHALYTCSPGLLKDAKALADRFDLPIGIHFLETPFERESLKQKLGMKPTAFLEEIGYLDERLIAFHCVWMDEEDIRLFADHGAKIVHNPESNMKLASGVAPVPDMLRAGVTVGLGTDGCASNNNLDLFEEMDTTAKIHKVHRLDATTMAAETVVRMATSEGAKVLGMGASTGMLKPGMKADIILIDLMKPHLTPLYNEYSHIVYAVKGDDVKTSVINGRVVMRDRRLVTIDEFEAMEKVTEIALKVKKSLGMD
ncbi:MAG: amidohydrolase [Syntrophobacterales bacterium]|jgi:5-methylthioadenosine/S-adenosylhomocysteine deaminase|nr:amidohydrolase [Syntrophobacterales bacterium]